MNKPAFIQRLNLGNIDITAIVCDQEEFNENIDSLKDVMCINLKERADSEQLELIKEMGHLPMCSKGEKTVHLFEKYNVESDKLSMIVRGKGKDLLRLNT